MIDRASLLRHRLCVTPSRTMSKLSCKLIDLIHAALHALVSTCAILARGLKSFWQKNIFFMDFAISNFMPSRFQVAFLKTTSVAKGLWFSIKTSWAEYKINHLEDSVHHHRTLAIHLEKQFNLTSQDYQALLKEHGITCQKHSKILIQNAALVSHHVDLKEQLRHKTEELEELKRHTHLKDLKIQSLDGILALERQRILDLDSIHKNFCKTIDESSTEALKIKPLVSTLDQIKKRYETIQNALDSVYKKMEEASTCGAELVFQSCELMKTQVTTYQDLINIVFSLFDLQDVEQKDFIIKPDQSLHEALSDLETLLK